MHGDAVSRPLAVALCLCDGCFQFRLGVLIGRREHAIDKAIGAGFVDLGKVGTFFALLANHLYQFIRRVGIVGVGEDVLRRVVLVCVLVAPEDVDGIAAHAHARTGKEAGVDGLADGRVG